GDPDRCRSRAEPVGDRFARHHPLAGRPAPRGHPCQCVALFEAGMDRDVACAAAGAGDVDDLIPMVRSLPLKGGGAGVGITSIDRWSLDPLPFCFSWCPLSEVRASSPRALSRTSESHGHHQIMILVPLSI